MSNLCDALRLKGPFPSESRCWWVRQMLSDTLLGPDSQVFGHMPVCLHLLHLKNQFCEVHCCCTKPWSQLLQQRLQLQNHLNAESGQRFVMEEGRGYHRHYRVHELFHYVIGPHTWTHLYCKDNLNSYPFPFAKNLAWGQILL